MKINSRNKTPAKTTDGIIGQITAAKITRCSLDALSTTVGFLRTPEDVGEIKARILAENDRVKEIMNEFGIAKGHVEINRASNTIKIFDTKDGNMLAVGNLRLGEQMHESMKTNFGLANGNHFKVKFD